MSSRQKSIKKNFMMNAILTMSGFIFPMISFPYINRILGPAGIGAVKFATSVVAYFAMFSQLGIPTYGIRVCAKVRDDRVSLSKTVHELLLINLVMSVIAYVAFFVCLVNVSRFQKDRLLFVIISLTIFLNAVGIEYLYKALEEYSYITIRSVIFKLIGIISMFFLVRTKGDYIIYGAITIFAGSASNILNFINSRKYIDYKWYGNYSFKRHYKSILIFFAMSCATTIYLNLDGIMLGFMTSDTDVGYYDAAVKVKTILVSVVTSLGTVLLPRASYYVEQGEIEEFRRITSKALNFVMIFAIPIMVYFVIFAREGIMFLSGDKFIPSILSMQIIMPTIIFIGLTNIMGIQILVPIGKEKIVLYSEVVGAVVDLIINFILIPKMQSAGAALGTTVAEIIVFILQFIFLSKMKDVIDIRGVYKDISYWKIIIGVIVASIMSLSVRFINVSVISDSIMVQNIIILFISAIIFFGAYLGILLISREVLTKEIIEGLIKKIKR